MWFRKSQAAAASPSSPSPTAPPPAQPEQHAVVSDGFEPDMRALARAVWDKRGRILGFTLIVAVGAFAVVNAITPRFRSEARILLEARENVFLRAEADKNTTNGTIDPEAVTSQIQVVLSRDLAREVIKQNDLASKPEFDPSLSPLRSLLNLVGIGRDPRTMSAEERTLESFYDRINVFAIEKSRVIAVDFSSADPALAARVANSVAETYLKMQQTAAQDQTRAAGDWLAGEIASLRKRVADAEAKVEDYRTRTNLFSGANNTSLPSQQLTEINSQISAARGQKADLEARARQLRDLIASGKPIESSDIAKSDTMRRLIDQRMLLRSQLAEQSTTLMDQHPRIKELKAQIAESDRQIKTEGERLARQFENDAKLAGDKLEKLSASLDAVKKLASQTSEQDVQLRALEREARTERALLESYLAKYREASARDNINAAPPEARIISRASPALKPDYPKKLPTIFIAALAAFMLSAGFTVTGALLTAPATAAPYGYARGSSDGVPSAAARIMPVMTPPMPKAAVSAPVARTNIDDIARVLHGAGAGGRRVMVTGSVASDDATAAAIVLARTLAVEASTVLIDCAFAGPQLAAISAEPLAPGLAELIRGTASFGDIITRDRHSTLHLVAAGAMDGEGAALAASPVLTSFIEALAQSYDYVLIDSGALPNAAIEQLAPLARRTVLVVADAMDAAACAANDRLRAAGMAEVTLFALTPQAPAVQAAA